MHPIAQNLLQWYSIHQRPLPWRTNPNPYRIWLSEIMLQQTRVDQGLGYFNRFIERFPTVHALAEASEEEVLKLWQGLGYYSRARNLHTAAKQVMTDFKGEFPQTVSELLTLKGVGHYTAAAVASIAFGRDEVVVDGNVHRLMARLFDIAEPVNKPSGHRMAEAAMRELLPQGKAAEFNQAVMEFGALHCTPRNFNCASCVLQSSCLAHKSGTSTIRPVKAEKTKVKPLALDYVIITNGKQWLMRKRTNEGIWKNLFDFPCLWSETPASHEHLVAYLQKNGMHNVHLNLITGPVKHILSHRRITAHFYVVHCDDLPVGWPNTHPVTAEEAARLPVPKLIESVLPMLSNGALNPPATTKR